VLRLRVLGNTSALQCGPGLSIVSAEDHGFESLRPVTPPLIGLCIRQISIAAACIRQPSPNTLSIHQTSVSGTPNVTIVALVGTGRLRLGLDVCVPGSKSESTVGSDIFCVFAVRHFKSLPHCPYSGTSKMMKQEIDGLAVACFTTIILQVYGLITRPTSRQQCWASHSRYAPPSRT